jgi:16S rRNA A1518/A1519 N6-dimethyltransferase RsmA/KsgA/DIM1 with predicted DNA glycosylase/AP lyase activity
MKSAGIDPQKRGEQLGINDFVAIAKANLGGAN